MKSPKNLSTKNGILNVHATMKWKHEFVIFISQKFDMKEGYGCKLQENGYLITIHKKTKGCLI